MVATVDEQDVVTLLGTILIQHQDAGRDARAVEQVTGQADDGLEIPPVDEVLACLALFSTPEQHAVRHHGGHAAIALEHGQHVLNKHQVGLLALLWHPDVKAARVVAGLTSRSNWAKDSRTLSISRPIEVVELICCVTALKLTRWRSNTSTIRAKSASERDSRMYLGEIVHKGQSFPGQHQAIITQAQWDAVHALIATDGIERRRETNDRQREPVLLRGLLFTPDGERLVPSYTVKKGKTYPYYTPNKHRRFGAWASSHGPLPAAPIEDLVTQQIVAALSAPHVVQSVWDRIRTTRPDLSEPEVVLPMRNLAGLWKQLFPAEQCRLAQLLIERVVIADGGLEIIWRDHGWQELAGELMPGTIGAELQEWEQTEEMA